MRKKILLFLALTTILCGTALASFCANAWQRLDLEKLENASLTTFVYDRNGQQVSGVHSVENRVPVDLSQLPPHVIDAFLAAEDLRFYRHIGVDFYRIFGALAADLRSGGFSQGASTITQQLVKLTQLSPEKTLKRKLREAIMALRLETLLTKDQILERYLDLVYFGAGAYGIEAAARTYFRVPAAQLSRSQAALLAGLLKSPARYAPHLNPENALARRNAVLLSMKDAGQIPETDYAAAISEPIELNMDEGHTGGWYMDAALDEAAQALSMDRDALLTGGYHIFTAMDAGLQSRAESLFADSGLFPANAADGTSAQAALAAVDPATGGVLALIGGREYLARGFHRAVRMRRQPGSAFKPISVYAAAMDAFGYVPSDFISDQEKDYGQGYIPRNASGVYHGEVTLREALSNSMNAAAVELISVIGPEAAAEYAAALGIPISKTDYGLSMALGALTDGVTPLEMASAYAALANGGLAVTPHIVAQILDAQGNTVYEASAPLSRVLRAESAFLITSMLRTAASAGTAKVLSDLPFPVAAKTGTVGMEAGSTGDAWTVAYTPGLSVAVWMGFDQPDTAHSMPASVTGGAEPARLARALLAGRTDAGEFPMPASVVEVTLDKTALNGLHTALLAAENTPADARITEYFPLSRVPTSVSAIWEPPQTPADAVLEGEAIRFTALSAQDEYVILRDGQEAAVLRGQPGEVLTYADVNPGEVYQVCARNRELYMCGVDKRSEPADISREKWPFWLLFR